MQKRKKEQVLEQILEIFMFENWLRFYFLKESGQELVMDVPEKAMDKIKAEYPHLHPLAEEVSGQVMTPELSRQSLCTFINTAVERRQTDPEFVSKIMDSKKFNVELQVFHLWLDANEAQLDEQFLDFNAWRTVFAKWKQTDAVQEVVKNLITSPMEGQHCSTQ